MKYNSDIHHRHSIRLQGYDYSSVGFQSLVKGVQVIRYQVTIGSMIPLEIYPRGIETKLQSTIFP